MQLFVPFSKNASCEGERLQCRLTISSWFSQALAMAASRESVSMIGVPSAPSRGEELQARLNREGLREKSPCVLGANGFDVSQRTAAEMSEFLGRQSEGSFTVAGHG